MAIVELPIGVRQKNKVNAAVLRLPALSIACGEPAASPLWCTVRVFER